VLVGLALATFLAQGAALWIYVTLGAAGALKPFGAPALTAPLVAVTWIMLLATYGFAGLSGAALPAADVVAPFEPAAPVSVGLGAYLTRTFLSISQVFLKASVVSALLCLAGLAVSPVLAALFALGGAMLAVAVAHIVSKQRVACGQDCGEAAQNVGRWLNEEAEQDKGGGVGCDDSKDEGVGRRSRLLMLDRRHQSCFLRGDPITGAAIGRPT
jgi:hypothetical protein